MPTNEKSISSSIELLNYKKENEIIDQLLINQRSNKYLFKK